MLPLALALALGAAVFHATWNVLLKTSDDPLRTSTQAMSSATIVLSLPVGLAWLLAGRPGFPPEAWLLAALSGFAEMAYFVFLSEAYRRGDLSAVYPLARGSAPLLAVIGGLLIVGERLSAIEMAGVLCLLAGIWVVRQPVAAGPALVPALLTAVCIAFYSIVDRVGVRLAPPWLYGWAVWALTAFLLVAWLSVSDRFPVRRTALGTAGGQASAQWYRAIIVGLLMSVGYLMILFALSIAPLSVVAPVRESAIVLVTGWGVWRLKERRGARLKLSGALGILAGIVLLAVQ